MTTGWLIVNIVLVAVVAAIVALPAVLIPALLDRGARSKVATPATQPVRRPSPAPRWASDGRRSVDAA